MSQETQLWMICNCWMYYDSNSNTNLYVHYINICLFCEFQNRLKKHKFAVMSERGDHPHSIERRVVFHILGQNTITMLTFRSIIIIKSWEILILSVQQVSLCWPGSVVGSSVRSCCWWWLRSNTCVYWRSWIKTIDSYDR